MIAEYINYLKNIRGLAENTATAYEKDLRHFAGWMQTNRPAARWSTITRDDIDAYVTLQAKEGLKPATTNRRLAAISGLYNYFKRQGLTTENPCRYESRRKLAQTLPNTIPGADLRRAYDHATGVTKTWLGLLATTGIRIQELLDMDWRDVNFEEQSIKVRGKGQKQRKVYTTAAVLADLKNVNDRLRPHGRMFFQDQRTARRMIWEALRSYSHAPQLSPHAIRHTFATNLATQGANVTAIGAMLGHKDIKTTQRYIDATQGAHKELYQRHSILT